MCHISSFKQSYMLNLGSGEPFLHMAEEQITLRTVRALYEIEIEDK